MDRIFGFSRNAVVLIGIVVAIALVVVVGMLVIGSAAIRALMVPGLRVEGVSLLALLVTIIVLLSAVFVLLLALFWCCCRQPRKVGKDGAVPANLVATLVPLLPLMQQMPNLLRDLGVAIYQTGKTIGWVHENISATKDVLIGAGTQLAGQTTIQVPKLIDVVVDVGGTTFTWKQFAFEPFNPSDPSGAMDEIDPLSGLLGTLTEMGDNLVPAGAVPLTLNNLNVPVADVSDTLVSTGKALGHIANTLNASPPPPSELLS